jgi:hypothetical protein
VIPALLAALALVDAMFCGFRDAAGRTLAIDKRAHDRRAVARGLRAGIAAVLALSLLAAALILTAPDPGGLYSAMCVAGERMVWVYGAYATLVFFALLAYLIPDVDVSILATVLILGPFTMLRPWLIWAGALWAAWSAREPRTAVLAVASAAALSALQPLLGRAWRRGRNPLAGQAPSRLREGA